MRKTLLLVTVVLLVASATALARTGESGSDSSTATTLRLEFAAFQVPDLEGEVLADPHHDEVTEASGQDEEGPTEKPKETSASDHPTTTTPADHAPPALQILHPIDGQVFEKKEVVFEGSTEPKARVFAGEYEAEVNEDGGWRIVLFLSDGTNVVTFKAVDAAGNVAEAVVRPVLEGPVDREEPKDDREDFTGEFSANQVYGSCSEDPPYDVFYGTGQPGSLIEVVSEYGSARTEVGPEGHWEVKVTFALSPVSLTFPVKVRDGSGHNAVFEFKRTEQP